MRELVYALILKLDQYRILCSAGRDTVTDRITINSMMYDYERRKRLAK